MIICLILFRAGFGSVKIQKKNSIVHHVFLIHTISSVIDKFLALTFSFLFHSKVGLYYLELPRNGEVERPRTMALNGAILIYHPVIDNPLVELYLLCHRETLYKVCAAPVLGLKHSPYSYPIYVCCMTGLVQLTFLKSLVWYISAR